MNSKDEVSNKEEFNKIYQILAEQNKTITELRNENKELKNENAKKEEAIYELRKESDKKDEAKAALTKKNDELTHSLERFSPHSSPAIVRVNPTVNAAFVDEKNRSKPEDCLKGFKDTVAWGFPCREPKRRIEDLKEAASKGQLEVLIKILSENEYLDINRRGAPDSLCVSVFTGFKDKTALILAAQYGHLDCVKFLVQKGANINYYDRLNFTALDYAKENGYKDVVDYLHENRGMRGQEVMQCVESQIGHLKFN